MTKRTYDLVTCTCSVSADESTHAITNHYLSAFAARDLTGVDVELSLNRDPSAVAATVRSWIGVSPTEIRNSHPEQRYHIWTIGDRRTLIPEHGHDHVITISGHHIAVTAEQEHVAATIGVRIVRQLIMRGGEARGGRAIHAGAVAVNGHGVLVGGHAGAGKTSVLTRLVKDHRAAAVSNDRTVLFPAQDGTWRAVGVPLAWRFTPEGIGGSSRLAQALANRVPYRGSGLTDGKVELTPWEISQIFDSPAKSTVEIARAVVLLRSQAAQPTATFPPSPPSRPDALFLHHHMDFGATDFFADDWLGIRPHLPGKVRPPMTLSTWWHTLVSLPVQLVSWAAPIELGRVAATIAAGER